MTFPEFMFAPDANELLEESFEKVKGLSEDAARLCLFSMGVFLGDLNS